MSILHVGGSHENTETSFFASKFVTMMSNHHGQIKKSGFLQYNHNSQYSNYIIKQNKPKQPVCLSKNNKFYTVHLDEETLLSKDALRGILNFCAENQHQFGQGAIAYSKHGVANLATALCDTLRIAEDYGRMRFQFRWFNKPFFGCKGSFLVARVRVKKTKKILEPKNQRKNLRPVPKRTFRLTTGWKVPLPKMVTCPWLQSKKATRLILSMAKCMKNHRLIY